jgi:orotate phosphoribosyltransferase-like protein
MPKLNLLTPFLLAGSLLAADPFAGTWKLNLAKSKYSGPMKPPKEETIFILEQGDQVVETVKGVAANGSPISGTHTVAKTGGEVKYSEGTPPVGTSGVRAKRKAGSHSSDLRFMRDGTVVATVHDVVSNDDKTIRTIIKGTDDHGKPFVSVIVYDRQ